MTSVAALMRRRAALFAELSAIDLEIADALAANDALAPPSRARRRRMVAIAPPVPLAPATPPDPAAAAAARADLARLGYRQR